MDRSTFCLSLFILIYIMISPGGIIMKYTQIGSLKVSKVCLGCMGFGDASQGMHSWTLPYEDSKRLFSMP